MNSSHHLRSRLVLLLILIGAGFLLASLYWTEIVKGPLYAAKAEQQYVRPAVTLFDRGPIYFSSKDGVRIAAATLNSGFGVFMNPSQLNEPHQAYEAISEYLKIDKEDFLNKASKPNDHYEIIAERVNAETAQSIKNAQLKGIGVSPESWRSYPGGSLAAQVLGLIGEDAKSSSVSGRYGLERWYEEVLNRPGIGSTANVFAQLFGDLSSVFGKNGSKQGSIVTTIEPSVQKYLEQIVGQTEKTWHSDEVGGIIIDPDTGEIVAMASVPTFDPNNTAAVKDIKVFSNPLVEHVYEMGSIMKPLTMAVALDTGAENPNSTYDDLGTLTLSGKKISNYDGKARGVVSMQEILSQSLNVGAATIALKVGKEDFARYFFNFGLGDKTGIDIPNEASSIVGNLKSGRDIEIATAAYGQGLAISPVNITRALSVLANGGYVMVPHLVREIEYDDGTTKVIEPVKKGPFISKQTADEVTAMLVKVVDEKIASAHPNIHWQNYSIAAKTGTAQIPDHVRGGYYTDRYLHSFFGYFPAYNPKFLVFLYQVYPKGAEYASETLTEPFSQLTKFLINYYDISPDR